MIPIPNTDSVQYPIVIFAVILSLRETMAESVCPGYYYADENVCITFYEVLSSWHDARNFCQQSGKDLVQIWNIEKQDFIKELRPKLEASYWIGASDRDKDRTYEYVNGTKVASHQPGLPRYFTSNTYRTSPLLGRQEMCVSLGPGDNGWESDICNDKGFAFICEKHLDPIARSAQHASVCTLEKCTCNMEDWIRIGHQQKFIKINKVARKFSVAGAICRKLGGHLLTIPDKDTQQFLQSIPKETWDPVGVYYWMGLAADRHGQWTWVNRQTLSQTGYDYWYDWYYRDDYPKNLQCAVAIWSFRGKWRRTHCQSEHYHICEAPFIPCHPNPILSLNGQIIATNTNVTMTKEQKAKVSCSVPTSDRKVPEIKVDCGGDKKSGNRSVSMTIYVNTGMHLISCVCRVMFQDGFFNGSHFTIHFKGNTNISHPRLAEPQLLGTWTGNQSVTPQPGSEVVIVKFEIYSNPKPTVFNLTRYGRELQPHQYNVTISPQRQPHLYTVTLTINNSDHLQIGPHSLELGNGIGDSLVLTFNVSQSPLRLFGQEDFPFAIFFTLLVVGILPLLVVLMLLGYFQHKRNQSRSIYNPEVEEEDLTDLYSPSNHHKVPRSGDSRPRSTYIE